MIKGPNVYLHSTVTMIIEAALLVVINGMHAYTKKVGEI